MKRSTSLRTRMFYVMAALTIVQSLALLFSLWVSGVFTKLDAEAFRVLEASTASRQQEYETDIGALIHNVSESTQNLSAKLINLSGLNNIPVNEIYKDNNIYSKAAWLAAAQLNDILADNTVSGAFVILNGSNIRKNEDAHSVVYLRNSTPGQASGKKKSYILEAGSMEIAQKLGVPTSHNWRLDFDSENRDYYVKPIDAAFEYPKSEIERYGYWAPPEDLLGDKQQVVTYTMPILDEMGVPYGVLGVEISLTLFNQHYLPNTYLPYQNSFFAITPQSTSEMNLDWFIPSGPLAQVYLDVDNAIEIKQIENRNLYETKLEGIGKVYCSLLPISMYSKNSPFYSESWMIAGFVPQNIVHQSSNSVRTTILINILLTIIFAFIAIFILTYLTSRKISGLSKYVQELSPNMDLHFNRTGILEIDELTSALQRLNRSVKNTSKILELTLLPIGSFELDYSQPQVILTEYLYELMGLPQNSAVSIGQWIKLYNSMRIKPAEGYEDIYRFENSEGKTRWLRILETDTDTGKVGVVLDVSKDIEEHRRLAHELDYDALTHLYNRTAFKRKAQELINSSPDAVGAMIFSDLDNLKYINDTFGHDMGDRLIITAGEMFRSFENYGGVVARISGDEFAVYLHGYDSIDAARDVIYRQYKENEDYHLPTPDGFRHKIRSSTGVAFYPSDSNNITDLLKLSDFAMYEAKNNQKGSVFEFSSESYKENAYLLDNRESINKLLDEGLIRFDFQPIVSMKSGEIYAYEALMRSLMKDFKSPQEIITVASAQHKLGHLERLVILSAFQKVADSVECLGEKYVFINSIPSQTMDLDDLSYLKSNYSDIFKNVVVEMTESEYDSSELFHLKTSYFRENGIMVAVDDFGSGYSNELRILSMSPDIVKIDIELISGINTDTDKQMLVSNIVSFCHAKEIKIVAEGVETKEELETVIRLGIDFVQGYYLARPAGTFGDIPKEKKNEIIAYAKKYKYIEK